MRFLIAAVVSLAAAALPITNAFTNGTLLPSYLCGPPGDGFPKSAGTLIPFLQLGTALDNFNVFPPGNSTNAKRQIVLNGNPANQCTPPTARQLVGAFHNGGTVVGSAFETAIKNPIWLAPMANGVTGVGAAPYTITPGALHTFIVATNCPLNSQGMDGFNNANSALDGLFLYALDTATGARIGSWVNVGATLTNWPACQLTATLSPSVGIVHNNLAADAANIAGLTWQAPTSITGNVQFIGAGCADCGFGPVSITYNTTTSKTALPIAAQGFVPIATATLAAPLVPIDPAVAALPQPAKKTLFALEGASVEQSAAVPAGTVTLSVVAIVAMAAAVAVVGVVAGVFGGIMYISKKQAASSSVPLL